MNGYCLIKKLYEIKVYERLDLPPYCLFYAGRGARNFSRDGSSNESAIPMILARIDRPIGPFASVDAAWDYVGDGMAWG
jgi:hypothetical protein